MAHATRPGPAWLIPLACLVLLAAAPPATEATSAGNAMPSHMRVLAPVEPDPEAARLPSLQIDPIRSAIPLNDRLDADAAFDVPFTQALRDGLAWYLRERGVRVVEDGADLRMSAAVEGYEGFRRPGRWGARVALRTRLYQDKRVLGTESMQALVLYRFQIDAENQARPSYRKKGLQPAAAEQVLFARIGLDLGGKMIAMLKKDAPPGLSAPSAPPASPDDAGIAVVRRTLERGVITIESSVDHAEVFLDGQLVGTTPLIDLSLSAGPHTLEIRSSGYQPWKRQIHVIERAASRFFAEMASARRAGGDGS